MQNLKPCPFRHVDDEGHILCEKIKTGDREVSPNVCRACPIMAINCSHLRAILNHETRPPIVVHYGNGKTEIWEDDAPSISLQRAACSAKVIPILSPRDCAGCALRQALITPDGIAMPPRPAADQPAPERPAVAASARRTSVPATNRRAAKPVPAQPGITAAAVQPAPMQPAPPRPQAVELAPVQNIPGQAPVQDVPIQSPPKSEPQAAEPVQPTPPPAPAPAPVRANPTPEEIEAEKRRSSIVAKKIIKLQEWLDKQKNATPSKEIDKPDLAAMVVAAKRVPPPPTRAEEKSVGWTD